jgi:hypothetical protein
MAAGSDDCVQLARLLKPLAREMLRDPYWPCMRQRSREPRRVRWCNTRGLTKTWAQEKSDQGKIPSLCKTLKTAIGAT